ncbi:septation protein SepH [Alloscardovia venturai]|uniref:Septation protein SepH n=2 Tax=Alloscardovia venturai TaxID=1769421 RepID=A0ABW2Y5S2_9BIFI
MTDNSSTLITFVRTDDNGDVIFRNPLNNEIFSAEVTDELEQGILAAKQIKKDMQGAPAPQSEKALPISMIQSLIRAGHSAEEISQEHGVSAALVRRFSGPVETEKKFAIAQFLDNLIPHEGNVSKISNLLKMTMASIGASYDDMKWNATRKGHEPWSLQATFESRGKSETAAWTFNPHDRSVVCVNTPAKRLFGEIAATTSPVDTELFTSDAVPIITESIPAQSAESSAVSMKTGSFDEVHMDTMRNATHMSTGAFDAIVSRSSSDSLDLDVLGDDNNQNSSSHISDNQPESFTPPKRKRSSIPAWDDILFGSK